MGKDAGWFKWQQQRQSWLLGEVGAWAEQRLTVPRRGQGQEEMPSL